MANTNAIIVGAGIAGIASAIRLAVKGIQVDVFEANDYFGGKLSAFVQGGFRFDAGPSLFTMPHLVDELFELAGKKAIDHFQYTKLELACKYFWDDGTHISAFADPLKFSEEIESKLGIPSKKLIAHLDAAKQKFELTKGLFLERSLHRVNTYFQKDVFDALLKIRQLELGKTMHEANLKHLQHPKLVQLFDRFATYNGSNPYSAPGVLNLIPHLEHGIGASFPKGGMHSITKSLVELAQSLGVKFHLNSRVEKILVVGGKATGIELEQGKIVLADLVVSNMDIVPTYRKLLKGHSAPEKVLQHERSSSALIFYWGINRTFPELDLHNIFFSEDYQAEFEGIFGQAELSTDPTIYVHISSKMETEDAPPDMENWFVMINVPGNKGQDWDKIIEKLRKNVIAKLNRVLNIDIENCILNESILDPRSIELRTSSFQGSLYGASSNSQMSAFFRHANFSSKIRNLYFCGGSVHPGGGIPLCLLSAKIVADQINAA